MNNRKKEIIYITYDGILEKYFDKEKKIFSLFPIRGLPTTFIANEEFKVFAKVEGIIEWNSQVFKKWLFSN